MTLNDLRARLDLDPRRVAVEHNLVIVKRVAYDSTIIVNGDAVEVVNIVGGGSKVS